MNLRPGMLLLVLLTAGCVTKPEPEPLPTATLAFIESSQVKPIDLFKGLESHPDSQVQTRVKSRLSGSDTLIVDMTAELDADSVTTTVYAQSRVKNDVAQVEGHYLQLDSDSGVTFKVGHFDGWSLDPTNQRQLYSGSRRFLKDHDLKSGDFYLYQPREAKGDSATPHLSIGRRLGPWQAELAAMGDQADSLIPYAKESSGYVQVLRPSASYASGRLNLDLGLEHFLNSQQVRIDDRWMTIDQRTGIGLNAHYALDSVILSASSNTLHSNELNATSQSLSAKVGEFSIGYLKAQNQFNQQLLPEHENGELRSIYAGYHIPYLFRIPDLQLDLEMEYTTPTIEHKGGALENATRYHLRIRYPL